MNTKILAMTGTVGAAILLEAFTGLPLVFVGRVVRRAPPRDAHV